MGGRFGFHNAWRLTGNASSALRVQWYPRHDLSKPDGLEERLGSPRGKAAFIIHESPRETVWKIRIGLDLGCSGWPKQGEDVPSGPLEPLETGD